ncbi:MAG: hypothetical protein WD049_02510 [Candidatus Paceibacterota bacterium]
MSMELEFISSRGESVVAQVTVSDSSPVPAIGDTIDVFGLSEPGVCAHIKIVDRKFRYNHENNLYKVTLYCEDLPLDK